MEKITFHIKDELIRYWEYEEWGIVETIKSEDYEILQSATSEEVIDIIVELRKQAIDNLINSNKS